MEQVDRLRAKKVYTEELCAAGDNITAHAQILLPDQKDLSILKGQYAASIDTVKTLCGSASDFGPCPANSGEVQDIIDAEYIRSNIGSIENDEPNVYIITLKDGSSVDKFMDATYILFNNEINSGETLNNMCKNGVYFVQRQVSPMTTPASYVLVRVESPTVFSHTYVQKTSTLYYTNKYDADTVVYNKLVTASASVLSGETVTIESKVIEYKYTNVDELKARSSAYEFTITKDSDVDKTSYTIAKIPLSDFTSNAQSLVQLECLFPKVAITLQCYLDTTNGIANGRIARVSDATGDGYLRDFTVTKDESNQNFIVKMDVEADPCEVPSVSATVHTGKVCYTIVRETSFKNTSMPIVNP